MKNKKLFIGLLSIGAMAFLFFFFHRNELGKELFHRGKALNKMIASLKRGVGGPSQQEGEKVSQKEDKVSAIMAQLPK
ncbi:MAG: hypothetical protein Q7S98_02895, partial [Deltaproteobacteria bacterium]|nr:hypothetical protein [Deltaproteobacteria bacterium]